MTRPRFILVTASIASVPRQGGWTWAVLQYVLGLRRLGHRVLLIDPVSASAYAAPNIAYFKEIVAAFDLEATLLNPETNETTGPGFEALKTPLRQADVHLNISGLRLDRELVDGIPIRIYLDLDPGFTQLWHAQGVDMRFEGHTHFATIGHGIGQAGSIIPDCGREWISTWQPVVLDHWPVRNGQPRDDAALTTVANWRGYGSLHHNGRHFGQKAHSMRELIDLPRRARRTFALAMSIHPDERDDLARLRDNGWHLIDPQTVADTPGAFQSFIADSFAEFGVAKSGYVAGDCAWFSDRSVCYLACGRPVIAQETGISRYLPVGKGLLAFRSSDEVLAAIDEVCADYNGHARAARALAEEVFDSSKVLTNLLKNVGVT